MKGWFLKNDLPIEIEYENGALETIVVPAHFEHDFASIPDLVPKWVCDKQDARFASIIHDALYHWRMHDREWADNVFLKLMELTEVPFWRRQIMYRAVRIGGQGAWES